MPSKYTQAATLTPELLRRLREVAREDMISQSAVVRQALKAFFVARNGTHRNAQGDAPSQSETEAA